jgi:predicted RNA binding protein YcfA (HicA-like mRNA interferase family)
MPQPAVKPREAARFFRGFVLLLEAASSIIHPTSKRRAVIPRHNRDIPKGTLLSLLREAGFTREEFVHFLEK